MGWFTSPPDTDVRTDARDIGAVAAKLTEAGHENGAYELTGSAALTYSEVARIFSDVLERDIYHSNPTPFAFCRRVRSRGLEPGFVLVMVALYTVCRFGLAARVTNDTRELLGREPLAMARFAQDYREAFLPDRVPDRAGVAGTRSQRAHNRQLDARHERSV